MSKIALSKIGTKRGLGWANGNLPIGRIPNIWVMKAPAMRQAIIATAAVAAVVSPSSHVLATLVSYYDFNNPGVGGVAYTSGNAAPTSGSPTTGTGGYTYNSTAGMQLTAGTTVATYNSGTTLNGVTSETAGSAFTVVGGTGATGTAGSGTGGLNGSHLDFSLNLTSLSAPVLTFAAQKTSTGFSSIAFSYSTNGSSFTLFSTDTAVTTSFGLQTVDFSAVTALSNQATVDIRATFTGASGTTGNNRLDNIQFNASAVGSPSGNLTYDPTASAGGTAGTSLASASTTPPGVANYIDSGTGGDVVFANGNTVTFTQTGITNGGGAVTVSDGVQPAITNISNTSGTYTFTDSGSTGIGGTGVLNMSGVGGTLVLNGVNSYTGGTNITGGTVQTVDGGLGTGPLTLNGTGVTLIALAGLNDTSATANVAVGTGGGTFNTGGFASTFGGKLSGTATSGLFTIRGGGGVTFSAETAATANSSTATGPVALATSTNLTILSPAALGTITYVYLGSGAASTAINGNLYLGETAAQASSSPVASSVDLEANAANTTIGGAGSIYLAPGTTVDVYSGSTTSTPYSSNVTPNIVLTSDGTNGHNFAAARFDTLTVGSSTTGISGTTTGVTFGATPFTTGTSTITVSDSSDVGTVILAGANTYTAPTVIAGGTLILKGSLASSAVTVNGSTTLTVTAAPSSATLTPAIAGTGTVAGSVTVNGIIAAGSDAAATNPGTLSTGNLTLNSAGTFVGKATSDSTYSLLNVTGSVTLGGSLAFSLGYAATPGVTYQIISNDGTDAVNGTFSGLAEGGTYTDAAGDTYTVSYAGGDGNDVTLLVNSVVPEPASASILLMGAGALLGRRRRNSRSA